MPDWQTIATLICLMLAGLFLGRRVLKFVRGTSQSSCGSCPSHTPAKNGEPLVSLDVPDHRSAGPT